MGAWIVLTGYVTRKQFATLMIAAVLVDFGVSALLAWWWWPTQMPRETGVSARLPTAEKVVGDVEIIDFKPKKPIRSYAPKAKVNLNLPATVQQDPDQHVLATGRLDAEERTYTLSAVADEKTGDSQVYARPEPLPLFTLSRHGALGVAYGVKPGAGQVSRLYGRQDLFRVKAFAAGVQANVDSDGDKFAGINFEWRW